MYIVDGHCDSIQKVDRGWYGIVNPYNYSKRYQQLQFVALFCSREGEDVEQCYQRAIRYVGHFSIAMANEKDKVLPVKTYADIERAFAEGKHAALMTMEGGTGIKGSKKIFNDFYNVGVRVFGLAWLHNDLAKSNRLEEGEEDTGLTDLGREIVAEGNRLGMIFDVSHLSDKSFWDLAEISKKPIIASHSNFRALCSHSRNLTDDMAREIIRQGGMIGLNLWKRVVHDEPEQRT
ncbi:MAG: membrane dipeptidase, partial [Clostridia bacterium]|nr:membrane dipeptidase [Clostridia bacterium]